MQPEQDKEQKLNGIERQRPWFSGIKSPQILLVILVFMLLVVFKDFLCFKKVYLFNGIACDTYDLFYPHIYHIADYISSHGLPKWSFSYGMGQSLLPLSLADPFDFFLFFFNKNLIVYGLALKELAKILFGGLLFYKYLKLIRLSDYTAIAGSLLFAFSGFMIVGGYWYIFSAEAFMTIFLLVAFELLFTLGKWYMFPLAVALISISQPFSLFTFSIFLVAYSFLRWVHTNDFSFKKLLAIYFKMLGLGLLGILLGAPMFLENINQLLLSPRGSGIASYAPVLMSKPIFSFADREQLYTGVLRFFSNNLQGAGSNFKGWFNYLEAPLFYAGLPCLLLLPQVFGQLTKKAYLFFLVFLAFWLAPVIFPWFRHAFWLFSGEYYRGFSFFVAFIILYYALFALDRIVGGQRVNRLLLIITFIVLIGLLYLPYFSFSGLLQDRIIPVNRLIITILLAVYTCLLFFLDRPVTAVYGKYLMVAVIILQLMWSTKTSLDQMQAIPASEMTRKTGYNDYTLEAVAYLKGIDSSFWRLDKTYYFTPEKFFLFNDAMLQGYRGTTSYSSFNQLYYVLYLQLMGIDDKNLENESRWTFGLIKRPVLETENRVKYVLTKTGVSKGHYLAFDSIARFGDVKVYGNKYVLPFGFTYSQYLKESQFGEMGEGEKDRATMEACIVKDADSALMKGMAVYKPGVMDTVVNESLYRNALIELGKDTLVLSKFEENSIIGAISASKVKMLYLTVPYDRGWKLMVDGRITEKLILNGGMTGVSLQPGNHTVELRFELPWFGRGLYLSVAGILIYIGLWVYGKKIVNLKL